MLPTPLTSISLLALIVLLLYRFVVTPIFLSPLLKIPTAHPTCLLSERWLRRHQNRKNESKSLYAAHQRSGPIVRVGPNEVSVNSGEGLKRIYSAGLEKHTFYLGKFENYGIRNLVSTVDHRTHSVEKRMISSVFAKSYVQHSLDVAVLSREIIFGRFLPLLHQYAGDKEDVNTVDLFLWAGVDFMSAYSFGTARGTNFLKDKASRDLYFNEWTKFRDDDLVGEKSVIEDLAMRMLNDMLTVGSDKQVSQGTNAVVASQFHSQLVQKAKQDDKDVLDTDILKRCASEMLDNIVATHETFAIIVTYLVYQLSLHTALQSALRSELLTLGPFINPRNAEHDLPSPDKIDALPLLNAVILETLRLNAPTPGRLPRVAPIGGMTLHDCYIPAGTTLSCNAYSLHRKEDIFPRPFDWIPLRWMAGKDRSTLGPEFPPPETIRRYMWAFGSGGRMCIGSNWAMQVIKLMVTAMYTSFSTGIIDDEGIEQEDSLIAFPKSKKLIVRFHEEHAG